mmetsp:Transcript_15734/g.28271  ORF Transcript_15734/g.28271 Transcript_15734/m.28271 type:complete len:718 (+) Transcript_15734:41-2194(+)
MSWGGGRRWKLGKSLLSRQNKAASLVDVADDDDDDNSGGEGSSNALSGLLGGGYDEDDDAGDGEIDQKLLESSDDDDDSDSPDEPMPLKPNDDVDWAATTDANTGKEYYWNRVSGTTSWEKPTELIDLDHQMLQYKKRCELVGKRNAERKKKREQAKKAKEERREVRAKLRKKAEAERKRKEEEEKKKAEEMKNQFASFMNMIGEVSAEQEKKKKEEEDKKQQEQAEKEKKRKEEEAKKLSAKKIKKTKWRTVTDKTTGKEYYWNKKTGTTTWTKPEEIKKAEQEAEKEVNEGGESSLVDTPTAIEKAGSTKTKSSKTKKRRRDKRGDSSSSRSRSPRRSRRSKRSRSRSSSRSSSRSRTRRSGRQRSSSSKARGSSSGGDALNGGENKDTLLINALAAGIHSTLVRAKPNAVQDVSDIPLVSRLRVEMALRINDWKAGAVGATFTKKKLKSLAATLRRELSLGDAAAADQPDESPPAPPPLRAASASKKGEGTQEEASSSVVSSNGDGAAASSASHNNSSSNGSTGTGKGKEADASSSSSVSKEKSLQEGGQQSDNMDWEPTGRSGESTAEKKITSSGSGGEEGEASRKKRLEGVVAVSSGVSSSGGVTGGVKSQAVAAKRKKKKKVLKMKDKRLVGLVNKWQQVQREHTAEDSMDEYDKRKLQEQKEIEEWKKEQVETGAAVTNENFIPVSEESWRSRVARKKAKGGGPNIGDDW